MKSNRPRVKSVFKKKGELADVSEQMLGTAMYIEDDLIGELQSLAETATSIGDDAGPDAEGSADVEYAKGQATDLCDELERVANEILEHIKSVRRAL